MHISVTDFTDRLKSELGAKGFNEPDSLAEACAFLVACGYPGLEMLEEARHDKERELSLVKDVLGFDLKNVSCVFLAPAIADHVTRHGRVYLRNVRHGLFLLPDSVASNYAIGCPVDPSFSLGGTRTSNPYTEKLDAAMRDGLTVDQAVWDGLVG
jgi:hypothetical protein